MTTAHAYFEFKRTLESIYSVREADNIADWVFESVTGQRKWERRADVNSILASDISKRLENYLQQLLKFKPVQYVLNESWFYKRKFFVDENVLIPRPETEELVEWIVGDLRGTNPGSKDLSILDIGTGSGCIAVSLKKEIPEAGVTAIDISENVVFVAKRNAHDLDAEINFFIIDFLKEDHWNRLSKFDIIVSNPPYIPFKGKEALEKNVVNFEPGVALFVEDDNRFIFYEAIAAFAKFHLYKTGKIYVEVHEEYAGHVRNIFENAGFNSTIKKDVYGKERMVKAFWHAI